MNRFDIDDKDISEINDSVVKSEKITRNKYIKTIPNIKKMMFLIGNCLGGAFFVWLEQHNKAVSFLENVFDYESLLEIKNIELNKKALLEYVAISRVVQFLLLYICANSVFSMLIASIIIICSGAWVVIVSLELVSNVGVMGIFLGLSMIFPHFLFYVLIFNRLYMVSDKNNYHNIAGILENSWHKIITEVKKIILILVFLSIGILMEVYINPVIIEFFLVFL